MKGAIVFLLCLLAFASPGQRPAAYAQSGEQTFTAAAEGFSGMIEVTILLDGNKQITAMQVGANADFQETEGLGARVKEDAFISQFIGKTGPFTLGENVDAIAGATWSSKGVVQAVNSALAGGGETRTLPFFTPSIAATVEPFPTLPPTLPPTPSPTPTPNPPFFLATPAPLASAREVQYNRPNMLDRNFLLEGQGTICDYYNEDYRLLERTHFCMKVAPETGTEGETWYVYFKRPAHYDLFELLVAKPSGIPVKLICTIPSTRYKIGHGNYAFFVNMYAEGQ